MKEIAQHGAARKPMEAEPKSKERPLLLFTRAHHIGRKEERRQAIHGEGTELRSGLQPSGFAVSSGD